MLTGTIRAFNTNRVPWLGLDACHNPAARHLSTGPCLCHGHFWHHCDPPSWITEVIHPNTDQPLWVKVREWRRRGFSLNQLYYSIYDIQWQKIMPIFILNLLYFVSWEWKLSAFPTWTTSHLLLFSVNALPNNIVISQRINFHLHVPLKLGTNIGIFG